MKEYYRTFMTTAWVAESAVSVPLQQRMKDELLDLGCVEFNEGWVHYRDGMMLEGLPSRDNEPFTEWTKCQWWMVARTP